MTMRKAIGLAATVAAIAIPFALVAAESAPGTVATETTTPPATEPAAEPTLDAAKTAVDPQTGELRAPTAAESAELASQMKAVWAQFSDVPHVVKKDRRSGRLSYVVAPTQMRTTVVTVGADGKPVYACFDASVDPAHALAELQAQPAATREER